MFIKYNNNLKSRAKELRNNPTKSEKIFWDFLRKEFPKLNFLRQKPLGEFIADFYLHEFKLIIEIDGDIHNFQKERDSERDKYFLNKYQLKTLRFSNKDIENNISIIKKTLENIFRT